jgi:hypothetical protein
MSVLSPVSKGGKAYRRLHRSKSASDDTDEEAPARGGTIEREWHEEFYMIKAKISGEKTG